MLLPCLYINFIRRLLEENNLTQGILDEVNAHLQKNGCMIKTGTIMDATIIAAPSSTKNEGNSRDPEMHSTKKGSQHHFGMKAHVGVDAAHGWFIAPRPCQPMLQM